jgi:hypothetical protein
MRALGLIGLTAGRLLVQPSRHERGPEDLEGRRPLTG